jgi:transposase
LFETLFLRGIRGKQHKTITIEGNSMNTERRTFSTDFIIQDERRSYSAEFKAQVALTAIKGEKSHTELAMEFAVNPNLVSLWKQQMLNNLSRVFDDENGILQSSPKSIDNRHAKIGQLMAENDFLTKVLGR